MRHTEIIPAWRDQRDSVLKHALVVMTTEVEYAKDTSPMWLK
ncbi:hypothetical protein Aros01_02345 [Streptosporangium roseum]|uniref:Uncharacterized protein n=2 Tax=Streptosporangium roseum TaxID=2001 RepID=D2B001_STRRD|nr:hypothetical protein Sros_4350 [Streptosporangium roseum DSM 43021]